MLLRCLGDHRSDQVVGQKIAQIFFDHLRRLASEHVHLIRSFSERRLISASQRKA